MAGFYDTLTTIGDYIGLDGQFGAGGSNQPYSLGNIGNAIGNYTTPFMNGLTGTKGPLNLGQSQSMYNFGSGLGSITDYASKNPELLKLGLSAGFQWDERNRLKKESDRFWNEAQREKARQLAQQEKAQMGLDAGFEQSRLSKDI